jgi:hypothetical protein
LAVELVRSAIEKPDRARAGERRPWLLTTVWVLLAVLVSGGVLVGRFQEPRRIESSGDSYWYVRQALMFTGTSEPEATRISAELICADMNRAARAAGFHGRCHGYDASWVPQRYVRIFSSRPGYPLVAAPFVATFGAWHGMLAATLLLALGAVTLAFLAVYLATGRRLAGLAAAVALAVLPSGYWMTRMLTEGGLLAGYLAVIIGAMLTWRGRHRVGLVVLGLALAWLFADKSAGGVAAALALVGASAFAVIAPEIRRRSSGARRRSSVDGHESDNNRSLDDDSRPQDHRGAGGHGPGGHGPGDRGPSGYGPGGHGPGERGPGERGPGDRGVGDHRGPLLAGGLGLGLLVLWTAFSALTRQPGLYETIQDFATRHFTHADVPDPYYWLWLKNRHYWPQQVRDVWAAPGAVIAFVVAGAVVALRMRREASLFVLIGLTGLAMQVAHPAGSEWDRMNLAVWLSVAAAIGLVVSWAGERLVRLRRSSPTRALPVRATLGARNLQPRTSELGTPEPRTLDGPTLQRGKSGSPNGAPTAAAPGQRTLTTAEVGTPGRGTSEQRTPASDWPD